jgi:hypothetical protein
MSVKRSDSGTPQNLKKKHLEARPKSGTNSQGDVFMALYLVKHTDNFTVGKCTVGS